MMDGGSTHPPPNRRHGTVWEDIPLDGTDPGGPSGAWEYIPLDARLVGPASVRDRRHATDWTADRAKTIPLDDAEIRPADRAAGGWGPEAPLDLRDLLPQLVSGNAFDPTAETGAAVPASPAPPTLMALLELGAVSAAAPESAPVDPAFAALLPSPPVPVSAAAPASERSDLAAALAALAPAAIDDAGADDSVPMPPSDAPVDAPDKHSSAAGAPDVPPSPVAAAPPADIAPAPDLRADDEEDPGPFAPAFVPFQPVPRDLAADRSNGDDRSGIALVAAEPDDVLDLDQPVADAENHDPDSVAPDPVVPWDDAAPDPVDTGDAADADRLDAPARFGAHPVADGIEDADDLPAGRRTGAEDIDPAAWAADGLDDDDDAADADSELLSQGPASFEPYWDAQAAPGDDDPIYHDHVDATAGFALAGSPHIVPPIPAAASRDDTLIAEARAALATAGDLWDEIDQELEDAANDEAFARLIALSEQRAAAANGDGPGADAGTTAVPAGRDIQDEALPINPGSEAAAADNVGATPPLEAVPETPDADLIADLPGSDIPNEADPPTAADTTVAEPPAEPDIASESSVADERAASATAADAIDPSDAARADLDVAAAAMPEMTKAVGEALVGAGSDSGEPLSLAGMETPPLSEAEAETLAAAYDDGWQEISLDAPITAPPITAPPITAPPITAPPITAPPITAPPITAPPITAPPITAPPITAPGPDEWEEVDIGDPRAAPAATDNAAPPGDLAIAADRDSAEERDPSAAPAALPTDAALNDLVRSSVAREAAEAAAELAWMEAQTAPARPRRIVTEARHWLERRRVGLVIGILLLLATRALYLEGPSAFHYLGF